MQKVSNFIPALGYFKAFAGYEEMRHYYLIDSIFGTFH